MQRRENRADGIRLRATRPGDLPALFEMQTDPEGNAMAGAKPRTREAFFAAWERNFTDPGVNSRVIELGGEQELEIIGNLARLQAEGRDHGGHCVARARG